MRKIVACFLLAMSLTVGLRAIVVRQEKDGRIVLTDTQPSVLERKLQKIKKNESLVTRKKGQNEIAINAATISKIRELCAKHGFRTDIAIAVARTESSFNPNAVSHKGAMGIMQLMLPTAKDYGVNNPFNVEQNLEGGIRHLKYLYRKYEENLALTLAAYNAGEEAVAKYAGIPPFSETQRYIQKVMAFMGLHFSLAPFKINHSRIYRYIGADGKIIITDSQPYQPKGKVEIFD